MAAWSAGVLRPGFTCPFCGGRRAFFNLRNERPAWRDCRACDGQGSPAVCAPAEVRIGAAQGRVLKPYPEALTPEPNPMSNPAQGAEGAETMTAADPDINEFGRVVWHSSDEDSGPDVGVSIGLGTGRALWFGEISKKMHEEEGAEAAELGSDLGTWIILYDDNKPRGQQATVIGKAIPYVGTDVCDAIAASLKAALASPRADSDERTAGGKAVSARTLAGMLRSRIERATEHKSETVSLGQFFADQIHRYLTEAGHGPEHDARDGDVPADDGDLDRDRGRDWGLRARQVHLEALSKRAAGGKWFASTNGADGLARLDNGTDGMFPVRGEWHEIEFIEALVNAYRNGDFATPAQPAGAVPDSLRALSEAASAGRFKVIRGIHDYAVVPEARDHKGPVNSADAAFIVAAVNFVRSLLASHPAGQSAGSGSEDFSGKFWLHFREPRRVPDRKGPFPSRDKAKILREFMAARPQAYISVVTVGYDGPEFEDGPQALQILDGRSMVTGSKHIERVRAAHGDHSDLIAPDSTRTGQGEAPDGWVLVPARMDPIMIGAFWRWKNTGSDVPGEFGDDRSDAAAYRAMIAARPAAPEAQGLERVRHVKRGTEYEVLGEAEAQISNGAPAQGKPGNVRFLREGDRLIVYRGSDNKLWCRFADEFNRRFVPAPPASSGQGGR